MRLRNARASSALLALGAVAGLGACTSYPADLVPLHWQKVAGSAPGGAVMGSGAVGDFDERASFTVRAFKEGLTYWLYYGGSDATGAPVSPPLALHFQLFLHCLSRHAL